MAAIHENILLSRMTMHIAKQNNLSLQVGLLQKLLNVVDGWMQRFRRKFPPSIQVAPSQRYSIITVHNAVWIQHGNQFEDEVIPQNLRLPIFRVSQEIYRASHHPRSNSLPGVNPCREHDTLLFFMRLLIHNILSLASNDQHWAINTTQCFAK